MRKINYPTIPEDLEAFKSAYKRLILESLIIDKKEANKLLSQLGFKNSFEEILVLPISDLVCIPNIDELEAQGRLNKRHIKKVKNKIAKVFNYKALQTRIISGFFMQYGKELNIRTCCYCNIDFIYPYIPFSNDYMDFFHFMDFCVKQDLEKIQGIGPKLAELIIDKYKGKIRKYEDLENLVENQKIKTILKSLTNKNGELKTEMVSIEKKNHFTLDHVLPQSDYPYLSLSLFNLVPSCYTCNSKLKREGKIYGAPSEINFISPTGAGISDLSFKIFFAGDLGYNHSNNSKKYFIKLDGSHKTYIEKLNLQGRYNFHKDISLELIEKRRIYSDTQIREIVDMFKKKDIAITESQLKAQIFGEVLFKKDSNEQFEKYKKDIAKHLGII